MTYAQNSEDDILARFFDRQDGGFFVDVGAYDGVTYSNTYLFEQQGWNGLCIEAHPRSFLKCQQKRRATCLNVAIVGNPLQRQATLYTPTMDILATLTQEHKTEIERIHQNCHSPFTGFGETEVEAMTLDAALVLYNPPAIDLLSIDVEWTNGDVLRGFTRSRWHPRVVVVEVGREVKEAMQGYHECFEHGSNLFYVRDFGDVSRMQAAYESF